MGREEEEGGAILGDVSVLVPVPLPVPLSVSVALDGTRADLAAKPGDGKVGGGFVWEQEEDGKQWGEVGAGERSLLRAGRRAAMGPPPKDPASAAGMAHAVRTMGALLPPPPPRHKGAAGDIRHHGA